MTTAQINQTLSTYPEIGILNQNGATAYYVTLRNPRDKSEFVTVTHSDIEEVVAFAKIERRAQATR